MNINIHDVYGETHYLRVNMTSELRHR